MLNKDTEKKDWKTEYAKERAVAGNSFVEIDEEIKFIKELLALQLARIREEIEELEVLWLTRDEGKTLNLAGVNKSQVLALLDTPEK